MNYLISASFVSVKLSSYFQSWLPFRHWSRHTPEGAALEAEWNAKFADYEKKYQEEAAELKSIITGELPSEWEKALPVSSSMSKLFLDKELRTYCLILDVGRMVL